MNIILDFNELSQTTNTTEKILKQFPKISIDNVIKIVYEKFKEMLSNYLEQIDRKISLELSSNNNVKLVSKRKKTIKTPFGLFTFYRRYYLYTLEHSETYFYALDELLGIRPRTQYTDGCKLELAFKASELTYRQAGETISNEFVASKSTVYRSIKNLNVKQVIPTKITNNQDKIHLQIDEKYVSIRNEKHKKRLYTATIFKGRFLYGKNKNKAKLLNKTVFSANSVPLLALKANEILKKVYNCNPNEEIYISGDMASYIRNFNERITTANAIYVADKFHVFRDFMKYTGIHLENNSFDSNEKILEHLNELQAIKEEKILHNPEFKKLLNLLKNQPYSLRHYNDEKYQGCSQECMNSRIYAVRFGKLTNKFNFNTILKLSEIKEAIINDSKLTLEFKQGDCYKHSIINSIERMELEKYVIDTSEMSYSMRKLFTSIKYGH